MGATGGSTADMPCGRVWLTPAKRAASAALSARRIANDGVKAVSLAMPVLGIEKAPHLGDTPIVRDEPTVVRAANRAGSHWHLTTFHSADQR
jgi:hypothetical protein